MSHQARLTSKSQVTVPKDVRKALGLKPGDYLQYDIGPNGEVSIKAVSGEDKERQRQQRFDAALKRFGGMFHDGRSTDEKMRELRGGYTP